MIMKKEIIILKYLLLYMEKGRLLTFYYQKLMKIFNIYMIELIPLIKQ